MTAAANASARSPAVDVGIPVYERDAYIGEAIESVLAQTLPNWRLTISDDGVGGGAVATAVEPYLGDPRVHYLPAGERVGASANWSRLLRLAEAPYVALLHDDDRWHPTFLQRRVAFLEANPNCGFVFSGTNRIAEDGTLVGHYAPSLREGVYEGGDFSRRLLASNLVGSTAAVLMRRSAYTAAGPYFDADLPHSDYEMWVRLASRFHVGFLAGLDADYRLHRRSTTHEIRPNWRDVVRLADHLLGLVDEADAGPIEGAERRRLRASIILESIAFDALTAGDRAHSSRLLMCAAATHPPALLDRRMLDWFRVMVGPRIRRFVAAKRPFLRRGRRGRVGS